MNILITIDNNYVEQALNVIASIKNYNSQMLNIFLAYMDLSEKNIDYISNYIELNKLGKLFLYKIELGSIALPIHLSHVSVTTYIRLFFPFFVKENIDRILYLDSDIICNGDISELYETDFENNIICAAENMLHPQIRYFNQCFNYNLGLDIDSKYVNAGVLLINLNEYRKYLTLDKLLAFIEHNKSSLVMQDQDVVNILFNGKIKIIDSKYNYQINTIDINKLNLSDAKLIHYSQQTKPWQTNYMSVIRAIPYYKVLIKRNRLIELNILLQEHEKNDKNYMIEMLNNNFI